VLTGVALVKALGKKGGGPKRRGVQPRWDRGGSTTNAGGRGERAQNKTAEIVRAKKVCQQKKPTADLKGVEEGWGRKEKKSRSVIRREATPARFLFEGGKEEKQRGSNLWVCPEKGRKLPGCGLLENARWWKAEVIVMPG